MKILFFSRGRGYGHAIPDLELYREILALAPDISIDFVSYGSGAEVFRKRKIPVIDLELPEANPFLSTVEKAIVEVRRARPDVVVAHEEFAALFAAKLFGVPTVLISAWLPAVGNIAAESLTYCDSIIVIGFPGLSPLPPHVRARVQYTGPILRELRYVASDRTLARTELGIAPDEKVICVIPGGGTPEVAAPIADLVLSAFYLLQATPKRLYWMLGRDRESAQKLTGLDGVFLLDFVEPIERWIVASDLVITKGNRGATFDAAALGVPSISLSHGLNPIDDSIVSRICSNIALNAKAVDSTLLARFLEHANPTNYKHTYIPWVQSLTSGAKLAASTLVDEIRLLHNQRPDNALSYS